jgi:GTPase SAR1 family protein
MLYLKRVHNVRQTRLNVKLLIIGEESVGKSSLMKQYETALQSSNQLAKPAESAGNKLSLRLKKGNIVYEADIYKLSCDKAEQYFQSVTPSRTAKCLVVVYDTTDLASFQRIKTFLNRKELSSRAYFKILLIGNKSDLLHARAVSYDEGKQLADQFGVKFLEISLHQGLNLDLAYLDMTNQILQYDTKRGPSRVDFKPYDGRNVIS